jgi:hypothetical protein
VGQLGSGGALSVADSAESGAPWQTTASPFGSVPRAVIGPDDGGSPVDPSYSSWVPVVGSAVPMVIGNSAGDPSQPPTGIFEAQDGIHFVQTSGSGPLFSAQDTSGSQTPIGVPTYHGVSFDPEGDAWVYADIATETGAASPSDDTVIYENIAGSDTWTLIFSNDSVS